MGGFDYILLSVGLLWICWTAYPVVPYFPIEISRMLESCPSRAPSIAVGTMSGVFLFHALVLKHILWGEALFFVGIVVFDDRRFWALHMLFVALLFGYISLRVPWPYLLAAGIVYGSRYILKGLSLWFFEKHHLDISYAQSLMLGTLPFSSKWTQLAFQVSGFFQWVSFAIIYVGSRV